MRRLWIIGLLPVLALSDKYSLTPLEQKSIEMAKKWMNNNTRIHRQKDGSISFYYGDNMPSLVCRPLNATVIKLEKGEKVTAIKTGDTKRWKFDIVDNAAGGRSFVLVKPTEKNIMTNLIIFTDKRVYNIKLISSATAWTPSISFIYNDEKPEQPSFTQTFTPSPPKPEKPKAAPTPPKKITKTPHKKRELSPYSITSTGSWKPSRIFTKRGKTYIDIGNVDPASIHLFVNNQNTRRTIHYKYHNHMLIADGIIQKAVITKKGFGTTVIHIKRRHK